MEFTWDDFVASLPLLLDNLLLRILLILFVASTSQLLLRTLIGYVVSQAVRTHRYATQADERKREKTLIAIFRAVGAVVVWVSAIIAILWQLNINIAALLTGAGFVGVLVGFGAQSTVRDFLAGFFIILENQYRVGDTVTIRVLGGEVRGIIEDITVRITRLRDENGDLHIVQNGAALSITNSSFGYSNVSLDIGVSYAADIAKVEQVIDRVGQAMKEDEAWSKRVIEPIHFLRVESFGEKAVQVRIVGKVTAGSQWLVAGEFRKRIIKAFKDARIVMPHSK